MWSGSLINNNNNHHQIKPFFLLKLVKDISRNVFNYFTMSEIKSKVKRSLACKFAALPKRSRLIRQ